MEAEVVTAGARGAFASELGSKDERMTPANGVESGHRLLVMVMFQYLRGLCIIVCTKKETSSFAEDQEEKTFRRTRHHMFLLCAVVELSCCRLFL